LAAPLLTGNLGVALPPGGITPGTSQLGSLSLGGPGPFAVPLVLPSLAKAQALPFIAHLYSTTLIFKKALGPLLNRPLLKWSLNAGHHPVRLDLPVNDATVNGPGQGDIVRLTEQGGDGKAIYTGLINDIQVNIGPAGPYISLVLDPLVTELGEAFFDHNYKTYTDIAQMARDCVNSTAHLTYTPQSIPDAGIFAIFNFHFTNSLDVLNTIKHIGGPTFWFYVDELGVVWFQAVNLTGRPYYTLTEGSFSLRKKSTPINTLKNYIVVGGGLKDQTADGNALFSIYDDKVSQAKYGLRALIPPLFFTAAVDQATLNTLKDNIGATLNQLRPKIQISIPALGNRIVLGRHGGPSIRYWEPAVYPMTETLSGADASQAAGQYSPNYVILDVEMNGPTQNLVLGPLPVTIDDFKYSHDGTIARLTHNLMLYPPVSTNHYSILAGKLASQ